MAHLVTVTLVGSSPYSQSRWHNTEKLAKELPKDYEARTARNRLHLDKDGNVFVPPMAFKNCFSEAAKFLSMQIPGKGKSTYTKHFEAGIRIMQPVPLIDPATGKPIAGKDVICEWGFYPADGVRGSGKRVEKSYPVIYAWTATFQVLISDDTITESVFRHHLEQAGQLIGIGRFRPRNNGYFGTFEIVDMKWEAWGNAIAA